MFNNSARKAERLAMVVDEEIDARTYNILLGGVILYGLVVNAILVMFASDFFSGINPKVFIIFYFISALAGMVIANMSANPFISFLGYNLIVLPIGGLLSICLPFYDTSVIVVAMLGTGVVVAAMICLAVAMPQFFLGLGRTLCICLLLGLVVQLVATFVFHYGGTILDWGFVLLFSLYIGYDWSKAQAYPKTLDNAVDSAIDIYLDIINIFVRLLSILSKSKSRR